MQYHAPLYRGETKELVVAYESTSMWNLKCGANEPASRTEAASHTRRTDLGLPRGREWDGRGVWGQQIEAVIPGAGKHRPTVQHRELHPVSYEKPEW